MELQVTIKDLKTRCMDMARPAYNARLSMSN